MKNVTISMDEDLLAWARIEAARAGQSVSRWIAGVVSSARSASGQSGADIEETIRLIDEFLAEPGWPISEGGKAFDRSEIYDSDERFRRFDDADLPRGSQRTHEESQGHGLAEDARPFRGPDAKSSGPE